MSNCLAFDRNALFRVTLTFLLTPALWALWVLSVLLVLSASAAIAQESDVAGSDDPWANVEEMLVLGTGAGFLEDVIPTSAIGFDATDLAVNRIQDVRDLAQFAPNLEIKTAFAAVNPVLFVRGVGLDDFNANSAGAVAIYQDGIFMNSPAGQLFGFFDLGNVEVLRGAQSGGYRNASAAAIVVQSKRPTDEFEAYMNVTYGNFDLVETEAAVNIPVSESVATRFSAKYVRRAGYTKNRCNGQALSFPGCRDILNRPGDLDNGFANLGDPRHLRDYVNDAHNWAARAQMLWTVPLRDSSMEWLFNVHGGQNLGQATQYQHRGFGKRVRARPDKIFKPDSSGYQDLDGGRGRLDGDGDGDPWAGDYNNGGDEKLDLLGGNLRGSWEFAAGHTLVSLSGVEWHDRDTLENTDGGPKNILTINYRDDAWQFSQDFRIDSSWTDSVETMLGLYYLMEDLDSTNVFDSSSRLTQEYHQDTRSWSVFGNLTWDLFDWSLGSLNQGLTLSGSFRYTEEFKKLDTFTFAGSSNLGPRGIGVKGDTGGDTFKGTSGSIALTYDISEGVNAYAKFTRGWKPGHLNGGALFSEQLVEPVAPEKIKTVEIGTSMSFFDDAVKITAAGFYTRFEDLQIFQLEQDAGEGFPLPQLISADGAEIWGAEAEFSVTPIEGFDINYNVGYLDTEYTDFTNRLFFFEPTPIGQLPPPPQIIDIVYTGNQMTSAPEWQMSGSVQYLLPIGRLGSLTPRFSFSWKDDTFFDPSEGSGARRDLPPGTIGQKAYALFHASLAWTSSDETLSLTGWVRNITEEKYRVTSFDVSDRAFGFVLDVYGPPRTFGATLNMRF